MPPEEHLVPAIERTSLRPIHRYRRIHLVLPAGASSLIKHYVHCMFLRSIHHVPVRRNV